MINNQNKYKLSETEVAQIMSKGSDIISESENVKFTEDNGNEWILIETSTEREDEDGTCKAIFQKDKLTMQIIIGYVYNETKNQYEITWVKNQAQLVKLIENCKVIVFTIKRIYDKDGTYYEEKSKKESITKEWFKL